MNEITKPKDPSGISTAASGISKPNKVKIAGFAGRAASVKAQSEITSAEPRSVPNRIGLILDNSGSMSAQEGTKSRIQWLRETAQGFVNSVNFEDTTVAMYPIDDSQANPVSLTSQPALLQLAAMRLDATGGTPMGHAMQQLLKGEAITRGVLVSDGESGDHTEQAILDYMEASIPMDCVHIGNGRGGEDTLKQIAERTGGTYIKFKDVSQFAKAMKYLTPTYRAMLNAPGAGALLGSDEIKVGKVR